MQETRVQHKNLEFKVPTEFYKVKQEKADEPEVQSKEDETVTNPPDQVDSNQDSIPAESNDKIEATEQALSQDFETKDPKLQNPVEVNIVNCSNIAPHLFRGVMMSFNSCQNSY